MQQMYDTWYLPWHEKMKLMEFPKAEYDTFKSAHHDPAFNLKDVQRRPKRRPFRGGGLLCGLPSTQVIHY